MEGAHQNSKRHAGRCTGDDIDTVWEPVSSTRIATESGLQGAVRGWHERRHDDRNKGHRSCELRRKQEIEQALALDLCPANVVP